MAGGKIQKKRHLPDHQISKGQHIQPDHQISKGQHIQNPALGERIVERSGMKPTDVVLEIGSGTGNLTKKFLENAMSVIAIELDPSKVLELNRRFQDTPFASRLKIITGDVLKCDLPEFDICVANVPHKILPSVTIKLLCHRHRRFRRAIILAHQEFAKRLIANPEDNLYCRLSVSAQFLGHTLFKINAGHTDFRSQPRDDFCVVGIAPRKSPLPFTFKEFYGLIRLCFPRENKTLGSLFRETRVLLLLEKNYKTLQALQLSEKGQMEEDKVNDDVADLANMIDKLSMEFDIGKDDEETDVDMVGGGEGSAFKEKMLDVLRQGDFLEKISSKLTQEDFMYLLSLFNKSGIHFS